MEKMKPEHHMFLQYFFLKGILDSVEVRKLFQQCCESLLSPDENQNEKLASFVITINRNINLFNLSILKGFDEDDCTCYYCLVNTCDNIATRFASDYTVNELELFKLFLDSIMTTSDATVGSVQALNLTHNLTKKMSKDDAQHFYDRMVNDKWLKRTTQGKLLLSTRSILELETYIRTMYPDLSVLCNMCNRICLRGQTCENCPVKLHLNCAIRYFKNQKGNKCPNCFSVWPETVPKHHPLSRKGDTPNSTPRTH